jgi:hypothetical protein
MISRKASNASRPGVSIRNDELTAEAASARAASGMPRFARARLRSNLERRSATEAPLYGVIGVSRDRSASE